VRNRSHLTFAPYFGTSAKLKPPPLALISWRVAVHRLLPRQRTNLLGGRAEEADRRPNACGVGKDAALMHVAGVLVGAGSSFRVWRPRTFGHALSEPASIFWVENETNDMGNRPRRTRGGPLLTI